MKALAALTYSRLFLCFLIASKTSSFINVISASKYLKFSQLLLVAILFSIPVLATHNPSVSHSANAVTNGTFLDKYFDLEVRL